MKRLTTEQFVERSNKIHNYKYDYSKSRYMNKNTRVTIVCPDHGNFEQLSGVHMRGHGCPKCGGVARIFSDDFIKLSNKIHNNKYDYSKVKYINSKTKVIIICPKHNKFKQKPCDHLNGHGCPFCSNNVRIDTDKFILRSNEIHSYKYDYSKVKYTNNRAKVIIICPKHGDFVQSPSEHLNGHGCKLCGSERASAKKSIRLEEFIRRSVEIHNYKYDYSKVFYVNNDTKVVIICPKHGEFKQTPHNHFGGHGCPICGGAKRSNINEFINKANKIHSYKYNYYKSKYINSRTKMVIICPKHGEFSQTPHDHLSGRGCSKCVGKVSVESQKWLDSLGIPNHMREKYILIDSKYVIVDACDMENKIVYEYDHPYWHGHPDMDLDKKHPVSKRTYRDLYEYTKNRRENILKMGYTVIQTYYGDKINVYYPDEEE